MAYIINHYAGFGDNIYHIPFVHQLAKDNEVFMYTPFPELFQFKNVFCLPHETSLKLQVESGRGNVLYNKDCIPRGQRLQFDYGSRFKSGFTLMQSFEKTVPLKEFWFEFSPKQSKEADEIVERSKGKKLCIVRLPSVRTEWYCSSRNSLMEHFRVCIEYLKDEYYFVAVGDIGNHEEYDGRLPEGIDEHRDHHFNNHLKIWDVVDLVSKADLVISIQCNMLPICQLLKKRSFFIYGGYVPHKLLNDDRLYQVGYAEPDPFCFCMNNSHRCNKEIKKDVLLARIEETICRN